MASFAALRFRVPQERYLQLPVGSELWLDGFHRRDPSTPFGTGGLLSNVASSSMQLDLRWRREGQFWEEETTAPTDKVIGREGNGIIHVLGRVCEGTVIETFFHLYK